MRINKSKGFTLIELLVVIAIIGILSSIVLVSVNSARNKAKNSTIKGDIGGLRVAAEIYYDNQNPNTYVGFCADASATRQTAGADAQNGTESVDCNDAAGAWAACAGLVDNANEYCTDSTGITKEVAISGGCVVGWTGTVCP